MAPWRMSVPIAVDGLKLKRKMRIGVMSAPPPMPVIPTSNPVTRPARASRGSFTRGSVDDDDVARGAPEDVLGDAALHQPLDEAFLRIPTTIRSASRSRASAMIASAGCPTDRTTSAVTPTLQKVRACSRRSRP